MPILPPNQQCQSNVKNPRWRTAAVLNVLLIAIRNCLTDFDEIWHSDAYLSFNLDVQLKF